MKKAIALFLLFPSIACAEPKHWYKDKKWWIGEAIIAASVAADFHSTARAVERGGGSEENIFLGPHPSNRSIAIVGSACFAYWTSIHALDWHFFHDDTKPWRIVGYTVIPAATIAIHGSAAIHNYEIPAAVREGLVKP